MTGTVNENEVDAERELVSTRVAGRQDVIAVAPQLAAAIDARTRKRPANVSRRTRPGPDAHARGVGPQKRRTLHDAGGPQVGRGKRAGTRHPYGSRGILACERERNHAEGHLPERAREGVRTPTKLTRGVIALGAGHAHRGPRVEDHIEHAHGLRQKACPCGAGERLVVGYGEKRQLSGTRRRIEQRAEVLLQVEGAHVSRIVAGEDHVSLAHRATT